MPRLKGSSDLLEDRRRRALALLDSGYSLNEVGRRIGCNPSSVMRWRDTRRRGGAKALCVRSSPGRPLKLDLRHRRRLVNLLLQGPMMHGYRTNLWTTARIAELIRSQFGIQYHRDHVGRLMHSLNPLSSTPVLRTRISLYCREATNMKRILLVVALLLSPSLIEGQSTGTWIRREN